jgi:hypothetical protein
VVECLLCKCEALSSNPFRQKKKKKATCPLGGYVSCDVNVTVTFTEYFIQINLFGLPCANVIISVRLREVKPLAQGHTVPK